MLTEPESDDEHHDRFKLEPQTGLDHQGGRRGKPYAGVAGIIDLGDLDGQSF
jgi:hypothetical protein